MQQKKLGWESVTDAEKLKYLILLSAEVYILRIGDLQPDSYFLDNKNKYVFLDVLLDVTISAAQFSQSKRINPPSKKSIKQICANK